MSTTNVSDRDRKIAEVAISILGAVSPQRLKIVVLNKALFYTDLFALRDFGHTLTGSEYLALPQGPTILNYEKRLVRPLERLGWAEQLKEGAAKPLRKIASPDRFLFIAPEERDFAMAKARAFESKTSKFVSDVSHENLGWKCAFAAGKQFNGKGMPINMVLAMQQIEDDDDWLAADFTDQEREVLRSSEAPTAF